jgi:tetratricopeptide (TPR) repeat protein
LFREKETVLKAMTVALFRWIGLALIGGLLSGCAGQALPPEAPPVAVRQLVARVQQAVVTIRTFDPDMKPVGLGTGFFINDRGHLITNYHVLEGAYAATVKTREGRSYPVVSVLADNRTVDLVRLSVDIPVEERRWLEVADEMPDIADQVMVVGSPLGLEQTVSEGIVSAIREVPDVGTLFQLSAPISSGSSGSPVVDRNGRVVGIVSFQSQRGQNLNFAMASSNLSKLEERTPPMSLAEWTYARIKDDPQKVQNLCREGFSFTIRGEYKKALNYFQEAVAAHPDDSNAWFGLGNCYIGLEKPEEAIDAYRQVIRTDPANANAYYNLGLYYRQIGRYEVALKTFQDALEVDPKHIPARFEMGEVLGRMGRSEEEKQAYTDIIAQAPKFYPAYFRLGLVCNRLGQYDEAIAAQKEVLVLKPDFAPAHFALGLIYANMGNYRQEANAYKEALRIDPDFVEAHYNMGLYYLRSGEREAALEEYKILKNLDGEQADRLFDLIYGDR